MASKEFSKLPSSASTSIKPLTIDFPDSQVQQMLELIKLTPIASTNYENTLPDNGSHLGLRRDWLMKARDHWQTKFNWKEKEAHINRFPHFKAQITDELGEFDVHFLALFSDNPQAVPILLLHGWPGSFLEFLPMMDILRSRHSPATLPYHLIVPSLPGFALSSPQPIGKDFSQIHCARVMHTLATSVLGFNKYIVQGGDVGSRVARCMGVLYPAVQGTHLNLCGYMEEPAQVQGEITPIEKESLKRREQWKATGAAYAQEHATRPATIGLVLSSNPIALLAWTGEKFLDWVDQELALDTILESVTLYWLTQRLHTNLWSYRHTYGADAKSHDHPDWYLKKNFGYSFFPKELIPTPVAWAATTGDLCWSRVHSTGGHFAAMERPEALLKDVEDFVATVWNAR